MGISYLLNDVTGIIISNWSGEISVDDMTQHWHTVLEQMKTPTGKGSLIDFGDAKPRINFTDLTHFVSTIVIPTLQGKKWKTAIVAHDPFQYSSARQFETLVDKRLEIKIFTNQVDALNWFAS